MRIPTSLLKSPLTHRGQLITLFVDGQVVTAYEGETVAAVLLAEGQHTFRRTPHEDEPRGIFCGMGVCYDCLVSVDGVANVRACLTPVEEGMRVGTGAESQRSEIRDQKSVGAHPGGRPVGVRTDHDLPLPGIPPVQAVEVAVVGAGPAGLEAALAAAEAGAQVTLIDSAPQIGGQYFKQPSSVIARPEAEAIPKLRKLQERLQAAKSLQLLTDTQVWGAFPDDDGGWLLTLHGEDAPASLHAQTLILAPGAYDRPIAFPGWTLPGVMTAGAVQTLLKSQGVLPGQRFVLAGTGPLQLVVAAQLVEAGAEVVAVLEATSLSQLLRIRNASAVWGQWERMKEGWSAWRTLHKASVPIRFGWAMTEARGKAQVETVNIARLDESGRPLPGQRESIAADTLVLGYGFLPSTQLTRLLGCEHEFAPRRGGWVPVRDEWMQTTLSGVFAVGDGAGIGGVTLARVEGRVAGTQAAHQLGRINAQALRSATPELRSRLKRERRFADLLGDLFTPGPGLYTLADDDTIICRCEEVRLADVRQAQAVGCSTLTEIKGLTRVGMGNC
jgi:NADPH-dependent 2,4-dienoyl-CoA reductase/sulfur reductase-like enzyme